jgi:hypothetical protein
LPVLKAGITYPQRIEAEENKEWVWGTLGRQVEGFLVFRVRRQKNETS